MSYTGDPVGDAQRYFSALGEACDIVMAECEKQLAAKGLPEVDCEDCVLKGTTECPLHQDYPVWRARREEERRADETMALDYEEAKELAHEFWSQG